MDFLLGINLVILGVVLLTLWYIYKNRSTSTTPININGSEIANQVLIGMQKVQGDFQDRINQNALNQSQKVNESLNGLELRFGEMQGKINLSITTELGKIQTIQTEQLGKNTENLKTMQNEVLKELNQAISNLNKANNDNFMLLSKANQDKLGQIQQQVDKRLNESFEQHLKSFESVNKNLGEMQSTAQKMIDSTKSVDKLNNIFERTNSKAFGQFSETYLETLLTEHLNHKDWAKQVGVTGTNDKIDFVINMGDKKIGIDSKFPVTKYQDYLHCIDETKTQLLEEFFKSVVLMATDINKKYLQPGFVDTLLLFLPSDSMYNEVVNNPKTSEKLRNLKVTPISPTTLFPIIVVINGYEFRLKVNQNAEMIMKGLQGVSKNVDSFREEFRKLGDKIRQAQDNFDKADRNLVGLQNNILKLEHHESEII